MRSLWGSFGAEHKLTCHVSLLGASFAMIQRYLLCLSGSLLTHPSCGLRRQPSSGYQAKPSTTSPVWNSCGCLSTRCPPWIQIVSGDCSTWKSFVWTGMPSPPFPGNPSWICPASDFSICTTTSSPRCQRSPPLTSRTSPIWICPATACWLCRQRCSPHGWRQNPCKGQRAPKWYLVRDRVHPELQPPFTHTFRSWFMAAPH